MREEIFKSYCQKLLAALDMGDLDDLANPVDIQVAGSEKDPVACIAITLMYGGPTLTLTKDFKDRWILEGSYGVCESVSRAAEDYLNDWVERTVSDYQMYYA